MNFFAVPLGFEMLGPTAVEDTILVNFATDSGDPILGFK